MPPALQLPGETRGAMYPTAASWHCSTPPQRHPKALAYSRDGHLLHIVDDLLPHHDDQQLLRQLNEAPAWAALQGERGPQPAGSGTRGWEDPEHGKVSLQCAPALAGVAGMVSLLPGTHLLIADPQKALVVPGVANESVGVVAEP